MEINLNDILIELFFFVVSVAVLNVFVFKPIVKARRLRIAATEDKEQEAKKVAVRAEGLIGQYRQSILEAKQKAQQGFQSDLSASAAARNEILASAREEGQKIFAQKKAVVEGQRKRLEQDLGKEVEHLADEFTAAVIE